MKPRTIIYLLAVIAAAASCRNNGDSVVLSAPVLKITDTTSSSFTVAWEAVDNADIYTYEWEGEQASTESLSVSFDGLEPEGVYTVKVKAVSVAASVESEWSEISVTLKADGGGSDDPESVFNMTAEMKDNYVLNVRTYPSDKELPYWFEPVPGSTYEAFGSNPDALFTDILNTYVMYYQNDAARAFAELHMTGDRNRDYSIASYIEPEFYVFAAGIDESMSMTTAVEYVMVEVDVPVQDGNFTIEVLQLTQSMIQVRVTPADDSQYVIILQDKETIDAMSGGQLHNFLLQLITENSICNGETTMTYERNIVPSHDYTVLVFGYEDGIMTTDISRRDVRTPDPEVVDEISFTLNVSVLGPQEVEVEVIPSVADAAYFYDVVLAADWYNTYMQDAEAVINQYAAGYGWTLDRYLTQFGSTGTQTYTYSDWAISPGTDYVLFAIGFNRVGDEITFTTQDFTEFSTPEEGGGGDVGDISFEFDIVPQEAGSVYVEVTPSDQETAYYFDVMPIADWAINYQYDPFWFVEDMAYANRYDDVAAYLNDYGTMGTDGNVFNLTAGSEYVVLAVGYSVTDGTVSYINYGYESFTVPDGQGGSDDGLSFELGIAGEANGEFVINIQPSADDAPYIYAVMTEADWDEYFPDRRLPGMRALLPSI